MCFREFVIALFLSACLAAAENDNTCFVVSIAFNQMNLKQFNDFNTMGEDVITAFKENAATLFSSIECKSVHGIQATRDSILDSVNWLAQNASPKDLSIVFITCHGETDVKEGWHIQSVDRKIVWGKELKTIAGKIRGHVLFVIDTCGAGGFARSHVRDVPLPKTVTAICSSKASQRTTNHVLKAFTEGLWGIADYNHDGIIDLEELTRYIRIRSAELEVNLQERPVIVHGDLMPLNTKLVKTSTKQVAVVFQNNWFLGRVVKENGATSTVRFAGYADDPKSPYFLASEINTNSIFKIGPTEPQPMLMNLGKDKVPVLLLQTEKDMCTVQCVYSSDRQPYSVEKSKLSTIFAKDGGR